MMMESEPALTFSLLLAGSGINIDLFELNKSLLKIISFHLADIIV
jgi:hypothetical protein